MYVCICKQVTENDIHDAVDNGACSYKDVRSELGVGTQCGECKQHARQCIRQARKNSSEPVYSPLASSIELTTTA